MANHLTNTAGPGLEGCHHLTSTEMIDLCTRRAHELRGAYTPAQVFAQAMFPIEGGCPNPPDLRGVRSEGNADDDASDRQRPSQPAGNDISSSLQTPALSEIEDVAEQKQIDPITCVKTSGPCASSPTCTM